MRLKILINLMSRRSTMRKFSTLFLAAAFSASAAVAPALADDWHHHDEHHEDHGFRGDDRPWRGDIHHFHEYDYDYWRGGRWFNGFHEGRSGWWWIVGGFWYFYPAPVYPYPDPYTPPLVVAEPVPVSPLGAPPAYVYYCRNPVGYYPYVPECFAHWERVLTTAAVAPAPPPVVVAPPAVVSPPVVAPPPQPAQGQREADDRELNELAVEFQNVDLASPHAHAALKKLEKKVEAFRQALYTRGYNAMDILKDADGLEHRIAEQREKLHQPAGAPVQVPTPAPVIQQPLQPPAPVIQQPLSAAPPAAPPPQ
jgi:hypothetical protein